MEQWLSVSTSNLLKFDSIANMDRIVRKTSNHSCREKIMKNKLQRLSMIAGLSVVSLMLASCESSEKSDSTSTMNESKQVDAKDTVRRVDVTPGVAGGMIEDTTTVEAKILAVNPETRTLRLVDNDGNRADFTVGIEVKNLDQLEAGEKVVATMKERLTVFVRDDNEGTSAAYAEAIASAPKGTKPGALVAESYQVVAKVTAIDATNRTATLKFADGKYKTFPVRDDVDLGRYKVGDSVVIRVTTSLTVVTKKQK